MAQFQAIGEAVNDGEREVLRILRDGLPEEWQVLGNFTIHQGARLFECDALAVCDAGWAYLIEVKAWTGTIRGNDAQWELPALTGGAVSYRPNPVDLTTLKAKVLNTVLREEDPPLKGIFTQPLVVLVSDDPPELSGMCAQHTVLSRELLDRVQQDPRPYERRVPQGAAARTIEALAKTARPVAPPRVLGTWELMELAEAGRFWEVWSARSRAAGSKARQMRLKRFRLDTLATGEERDAQATRARQDLGALQRLNAADGAVPLVSSVEDDGEAFFVVTEWPAGKSLAALLEENELDEEDALDIFEALVGAAATVHRIGVVHRNITPRTAFYERGARVVLTDFDYARIPRTDGVTAFIEDDLDTEYTAPEVRTDPAAASAASDVWSLARIGLGLFRAIDPDGQPIPDRLPADLRQAVLDAFSDEPAKRPADADLLLNALRGDDDVPLNLFGELQPNDELDSRWVVRSDPVGEGGIARVYRVHDARTGQDFAAKFVRDEFTDALDPAEEYRLLLDVPDHPGIVKPQFVPSVAKLRRDGRSYRYNKVFLLTRWVSGTRLDKLLAESLPPARAVEITLALVEATDHLHSHKLLHRDLKPQNVIVDEITGNPRVVDFNVSQTIDVADRTDLGTRPYRPPDHETRGWSAGSDVYAVGVILCELLAGKLLRPGPHAWLADADLTPGLRAVLERAVATDRETRFERATDFGEAVRAASTELSAPPVLVDAAPLPLPPSDQLERPDWNPFQARLVGLFSQSTTSNAGTRGLDDFARWAYVETAIDRELFPAILTGRYRLVLITGNAGDGKTAFIQMLEKRLEESGAPTQRRPRGNGAVIEHEGRRFVTNWDGSQDEGDQDNDDVLREFFEPFGGESPRPPADETRVIAINEGRLLDFVAKHRDDHQWLSRSLLGYFSEEAPLPEAWIGVVNLNLRALTLNGTSAIVRQLLERFSDQRLWDPCKSCSAFDHCYARANADVLRDPILGQRAAERVRQTLDLVRLRRRLHITMRDLRSALAFIVAGNHTCDEIVGLVNDNDRDALLAGHLYNSLFAASEKLAAPAFNPSAGRDRLLSTVGTLDVARTADPEDDSRLWTLGVDAIRPDPPTVARTDRQLLIELRERLPKSSEQLSDRRARTDMQLLQASLRRKLFLEREDPAWLSMFPYERLTPFMRQLDGRSTDRDRDEIATAISNSEGLFSEFFRDRVAIRLVGEGHGPERTYVTHRASDFKLDRIDRSAAAEFVEYQPDTLRFKHADIAGVELEIDLDLYETLTRILAGFTPSREELRGAWLNLRIFKDTLASAGADSLLLTTDDRRFHKLYRRGADAVVAENLG